MSKDKKPHVKLTGVDGNAFNIIGLCRHAAKRAGWAEDKVKAVTDEMMAGDYDHLLQTAMTHFDVD